MYTRFGLVPQIQKPYPRTKHGLDRMHRLRDIRLTVTLKVETGIRGHSRSSKVAILRIGYDFIFIFHSVSKCLYLLPFPRYRIATYWSKIGTPLVFGAPLGVKPSDLRNVPWWRNTSSLDRGNLAQRLFKVIGFGTNRKRVYIGLFLLVVNNNLDPILHHFRDTAV